MSDISRSPVWIASTALAARWQADWETATAEEVGYPTFDDVVSAFDLYTFWRQVEPKTFKAPGDVTRQELGDRPASAPVLHVYADSFDPLPAPSEFIKDANLFSFSETAAARAEVGSVGGATIHVGITDGDKDGRLEMTFVAAYDSGEIAQSAAAIGLAER